MDHFADRFFEQARLKGAPVCVGLDPVVERLPPALRDAAGPTAIEAFSMQVLEATADLTPCVKVQSACFERFGSAGVAAHERVMRRARELGLLVINDAKRGDIGLSAEHYAAGCLDDADALTINTYFGPDGIEPFVRRAALAGKGLFALVRTSNPGGAALQSLSLGDGRSVCDAAAQMVHAIGEGPGLVGASGYSLLGAVVGATNPGDAARLRGLMPRQLFLVPGYGAQGGSAADVRACLAQDGGGAIITASRSVIYAFDRDREGQWIEAVRRGALALRDEIAGILGPAAGPLSPGAAGP